ncbi:thioesterase II family protein [Actinophytocola oryzae]|uniref:Surfactin synthase thioesterase subunit n=1 Tax=Actinophytocola oryzae TaxID=502181 RepID=A0A4R7V3P0_9PSEU|nr:alpha/beta fold hydrolase [Actinophytocola oryzae]TDV43217.1 surfactin synthase thioesterase subunit [Actinophytocola oryzae]
MARWLRDWTSGDDAVVRLLCFPPGGGGPQVYRRWARRLPDRIGVLAVELPGHGARLRERPPTSVAEIVDGPLRDEVEALLDRPVVAYGHSMGALVALELFRRLGVRPDLFVAGACGGPELEHVPADVAAASDDEVVDFLRTSGGTDPAIFADPEYLSLLLPIVRADLAMIAGHRFAPDPPLGCPVRVYLGADDPSATVADAAGWAAQSDGDHGVAVFPGGHFFFQNDEDAVLTRLSGDVDAVLSPA